LYRVGAWDPFNVTEDADLGIRLARLGYRTGMIDSSTYEEAPSRLYPWIKQRSRWFKGWLQCWLVHMRAPHRLMRALGPARFCIFQLLVGGSVLAALVHPIFLLALLWALLGGEAGATSPWQLPLSAAVLSLGYAASIVLALTGLRRRRLLHEARVLLLMPLYWLMLSAAAWRALYQLLRDPHRWEKTEHGLARTSRLAQQRHAQHAQR
jgi:cellulose synthase/poly-beta-1,6-N-acetylglucosamine synthase-like glycosyltransferase